MPLVFGIIVSIILLIVVTLRYKDRQRQMQLANITLIQLILVMGLFAWIHYNLIESIKLEYPEVEIGYGVAVVFPLVSMLLLWLAKKSIKKDDDLVRSADRLR
jgi:putative effector of murein hydrolase